MNKVNGTQNSYAPIREEGSRITICYGLKKLSGNLYEWIEIYLPKKQVSQITLEDVKAAIVADINERITNAIISGFVWEDKPVWYSLENQINFSQASAPAMLKIGEEENGTPVYHQFDTDAELRAFNEACLSWKNECLEVGRAEKEGMDWTPYENFFPNSSEEV